MAFTRRQQRNEVWDHASVIPVERFRVSSSCSRVLAVGTQDPKRNQRTAFCVQPVLSKSRICGARDFFLFNKGVGDGTAAKFAADVGGVCPQYHVCTFTLNLYFMHVSRSLKER